jgi:hypothetical protein
MNRYGMRHSSIRYFQNEAKWLADHYGREYAINAYHSQFANGHLLTSRKYGHLVIALAYLMDGKVTRDVR